jgi:sugar/nucleoside kinase (ribokinase family)
VDTTGAGDAFNAGFLAGLLSGLPARRVLRLGNTVGARSTRAVGGLDGLPRLEEL